MAMLVVVVVAAALPGGIIVMSHSRLREKTAGTPAALHRLEARDFC